MKQADLAVHLFPILAPFYGWQNRTSVRIEQLKGLLTDMYEQQMLLRDGVSHRYFVR